MRSIVRGSGLAGTTNLALLAPVREGGLASAFEPVSHLERLRRLLSAMHASRRNARESELRGSVFPDPIGRFGIISHFRYALVPPGLVGATRWHLSLNVTFDGGWEPYMRVIYRDIGPLLDALLCHCEGYPGSRTSDFDTYCRWVRKAELDAGIYYTDSPATLADQRYLASVERLQRESSNPAAAERAIAAHAEPDDITAMSQGLAEALRDLGLHLPLHLRALKGLYRLTAFWAGPDGDILLRFAQLVLAGFQKVIKAPEFNEHPEAPIIKAAFADELAWLARPLADPAPVERLAWDTTVLQGALLNEGPRATHGALVLLRVIDPHLAAAHLSALAPRCAAPAAAEGEARLHVAFTMAGLRALQIHPERLDRLPPEFDEGMEPRAGLLGDVRGNHPDHWRRPLRHGVDPAREDRISLGVVHVAVMLRTIDAAEPGHDLHPLLAAEVNAFGQPGTGLAVLAVEVTRSRTAQPDGREHFGFVDGISQPIVVPDRAPDPRQHEVRPGELVLGFGNDRGDGPFPPEADGLLDHGSFLVVRKLRQRLDHLNVALDAATGGVAAERSELLERMMGRRQSGDPLVMPGPGGRNDFDFRATDGLQCPFASHARRTNPRDGRPAMPRILRRGMGYGPAATEAPAAADRGTLFMAYCSSIAEQFETVQRWVAGGNSSGVSSTQSDPLLGVPRADERRMFRWVDATGAPQRAELGAKAFVELQWGLYLFVPALPALQRLADFRTEPIEAPAAMVAARAQIGARIDHWRERLEDRDNGRATWKAVREQHGGMLDAAPYGRLVGTAAGVFDALADATCAKVSVQGFGERMSGLGVNHLGMDPADGHTAVGSAVNHEIAAIDEAQAFARAHPVALAVLGKITQLSSGAFALRHPDGRLRLPVDLMNFAEQVVGALAKAWFGLPDGVHMLAGGRLPAPPPADQPPRCPGHIIGPSRMIFGAHPHDRVAAEGGLHGPMVKKAVKDVLAAGPLPGPGTVTARLRERLAPLQAAHGADLLEREVAGLLLGFAPTVYGNFLTVMRNWIENEERLWTLQQDLAGRIQAGDTPLAAASAALLRPMLDTMQGEPVPPMVWRRPVAKGTPDPAAPPVVLGLASAIESLDPPADHQARRDALLFGGDYFAPKDSGRWGLHACPGSKMGLGVMLAMAAVLLDAGTLRSTGSPVLLMLTPKTPAP
jgi:Dyp-type peroxidase family